MADPSMIVADATKKTLTQAAEGIRSFQKERFGSPCAAYSMLKLQEEVGELAEAIAKGDNVNAREECADVLFLLLSTAASLGMSVQDLADEAGRKLEKNRRRSWSVKDGIWSGSD